MDLKAKKWSFSSVKLFEQCPYAFYQKYVLDQSEGENAFAQHGKFAHNILERCLKGELMPFELADIYESEYKNNVTQPFPYPNTARSFYDKTLQYFQNYDDFHGEIVAVEEKLETKFGEYNFVGYADLLLKDEHGYVLVDHKSHAAFKSKAERKEYFKQLYLYAECIKRKYGEYPYKLTFNMFRIPKLEEELFAPSQHNDTVIWFEDAVTRILQNTDWDCNVNSWYCNQLCGFDCVWR